jgi:hypothetical protein
VIVVELTEKNSAQDTPLGKYFFCSSSKITSIIFGVLIHFLLIKFKLRPSE